MWPFKPKRKPTKVTVKSYPEGNRITAQQSRCPQQQLVTKQCVCIECPKKGTCFVERIKASDGNCENFWVEYCSRSDKADGFEVLFGPYYKDLIRRVCNGI